MHASIIVVAFVVKESFVFRNLILIHAVNLQLILVEFDSARIYTQDICKDARDQEAKHESTRELSQCEGNAHVEYGIS